MNTYGGWFVTFGDLLTLLLCLFVMLIALNKPGPMVKRAESKQISCGVGNGCGVPALGTPLAPEATKESKRQSADASEKELVVEVTNEQLQDADPFVCPYDLGIGAQVTVETCGDGLNEDSAWFNSLQRALTIRERLILSSIQPDAIAVRALGPECPNDVKDRQIAARLIFKLL
jgi:flagellar motor protein MotB